MAPNIEQIVFPSASATVDRPLWTVHCALKFGGADRDRTGDPLLAKQVLSQLSYSPVKRMVGLGRVELPTSPLSGVRSSQLSYRPVWDPLSKNSKI